MQTTFKAAALAIAASGMAVSAPLAAAPASHGAPTTQSAYGGSIAMTETASHHRGWHRGGHGNGYYDDRARYDDRRYRDRYQDQRYRGDRYYGEPVYRDTRVWRDRRDGQYYCQKKDGTTGLLIGGAAGALLGREVARDRTLGAIVGGAAGALLGRSIDRGNARCR